MSDDSEKMNNPSKLSKLSVSDVYDADSDSSNKDVRETDANAMDVSKFCKTNNSETELKMLNSEEKANNYDTYFEHMKSKKKKRKKSKEEKSSKHHHPHHHHRHNHHHDKTSSLSLPSLDDVTPTETPAVNQAPVFDFENPKDLVKSKDEEPPMDGAGKRKPLTEAVDILTSSIAKSISEETEETKTQTVKSVEETAIKSISNEVEEMADENVDDRAVKSIAPAVNENVHDRAVMSISNVLMDPAPENGDAPIRAPAVDEKSKTTNAAEEKTGGAISQEETEDAIAAILGESSEFGFDDCFSEQAMKPETPGSDHELLIDTDTEETGVVAVDKNETEPTDDITVTSSEESFVTVCDKTPNLPEPPKITPLVDAKDSILEDYVSANNSLFGTPRELSPEKESRLVPRKLDLDAAENEEPIKPDVEESPSATAVVEEPSPVAPPATVEDAVSHVEPSEEPNIPDVLSVEEPSDLTTVEAVTDVSVEPEEPVTSVCDAPVAVPEVEETPVVVEETKEPAPAAEVTGEDTKSETEDTVQNSSTVVKPDPDPEPEVPLPPEVQVPLPPTQEPPNNLCRKSPSLSDESPDQIEESPVVASSPTKEVPDPEKEIKRRERKRSYAKCNGPSSLTVEEQLKIKPEEPPVTPQVEEKPTEIEAVESADSKVANEELPEPTLISSTEEENPPTPPQPDISKESIPEEKPLTDHTYNSIVKTEPNPEVPETPESTTAEIKTEEPVPPPEVPESSKSAVEVYRSVMLDCIGESQSNKEKEEAPKVGTLEDTTPAFLNADKIERNEPDAALKQKLPIPAQQNTELSDAKEVPASNTEANEANKENIVKSVNDFSKCNHKVPNILEKVVQRIHESKRIIQKSEEYVASNPNLTPINLNDKVALVTEEEITSAEILLKMSETGIIKNQVTDYSCVIKMNRNKEEEGKSEAKVEDKDSSSELKNESFSSTDGHQESIGEVTETPEDHHPPYTG